MEHISYIHLDDLQQLPGRTRSKSSRYNNPISPLSPEFFEEKLQIQNDEAPKDSVASFSTTIPVDIRKESMNTVFQEAQGTSPKEKALFTRPRANDYYGEGDKLNQNDLIPAKNRTPQGQKNLNSSLSSLHDIKSSLQGKSQEEISKLSKIEIEDRYPPIKAVSESAKMMHLTALKNNKLPQFSDANRLVSLELGKALLRPKNSEAKKMKDIIAEFLSKGFSNPKVCGEELWRSMECTKIYDAKSDTLIDATTIKQDDDAKRDLEICRHMGMLLNLLFKHVSQTDIELIPPKDFGASLIDAGILGKSLAQRLKKKKVGKTISTTMQRMLGLGKQELYTHPATWTIPKEYLTSSGTDELIISEFGPTVGEILKPLQYNREILIELQKDRSLKYTVVQPITFKERAGIDPLGTCRMQTTFLFDKDMNCLSQTQEIKAASILET